VCVGDAILRLKQAAQSELSIGRPRNPLTVFAADLLELLFSDIEQVGSPELRDGEGEEGPRERDDRSIDTVPFDDGAE
jgi:hypothetical protein